MTNKVSLTDLVNLQNETTAVNAINANNAAITTAMNNTLSRDGSSPNPMNSSLDMNSNQIINLPAPLSMNAPARLVDVVTNPTILIPQSWSNGRSAKTANYTVSNSDKDLTLALGGSAFFTLTFNAPGTYDANFLVAVVNEDGTRAKIVSLNGLTFFLYPFQSIIVYNQSGIWETIGRGRWRLPTSPGLITMFVNSTFGNDSNDGFATGLGAKATLTAALNQVASDIDINLTSVLIKMEANETSTGVHIGTRGFFIGTGGGGAVTVDGGGFTLNAGTNPCFNIFFDYSFVLQNITMIGGNCIALDRGHVRLGPGVVLGQCVGTQLFSAYGSKMEINSPITVSGGGQALFGASGCGVVISNNSITFSSDVTYTAATVFASNAGVVDCTAASFVLGGHVVTGQRWTASGNGVVASASGVPNTFFPGNSNGSALTGGQGF